MTSRDSRLGHMLLGPLANEPAAVRERMLATVLQSRASLVITSCTLLLICLTAAIVSGSHWAWFWAGISSAIIAWRLIYPVLAARSPIARRRIGIMIASALLFTLFGMGSALAISSQDLALSTMSVSAVLGIVAGLASRWAALPRAAIGTMILASLPPIVALALLGGPHLVAAIAIAFVVASIGAFTIQNHRNLLNAISADERSAHLARTDALTGLFNRAELTQRLATACAAVSARPVARLRSFAVLYLDLDGFKAVNDNLGHAAGDALLRKVAEGLREVVAREHTIARMGGDEFVVLLEDADEAEARAAADRIIDRISRDHELDDGRSARIGCSVGVSLAPHQGCEPDLLMARADAALYMVKNQGKGQSGFWRALA